MLTDHCHFLFIHPTSQPNFCEHLWPSILLWLVAGFLSGTSGTRFSHFIYVKRKRKPNCWLPSDWRSASPWAMRALQTPPSAFISEHNIMKYRMSLWPAWVAVLVLSPPDFCALPASLLAGQCKKLKSPWFSVSTTQ